MKLKYREEASSPQQRNKKERVNRHRNVTDMHLFTIAADKKYDLGNLFVDKEGTLAQQELW
jgi:hypothetical protein